MKREHTGSALVVITRSSIRVGAYFQTAAKLPFVQKCTREQADRLLVIAMKESKVGRVDEFAITPDCKLVGSPAGRTMPRKKRAAFHASFRRHIEIRLTQI